MIQSCFFLLCSLPLAVVMIQFLFGIGRVCNENRKWLAPLNRPLHRTTMVQGVATNSFADDVIVDEVLILWKIHTVIYGETNCAQNYLKKSYQCLCITFWIEYMSQRVTFWSTKSGYWCGQCRWRRKHRAYSVSYQRIDGCLWYAGLEWEHDRKRIFEKWNYRSERQYCLVCKKWQLRYFFRYKKRTHVYSARCMHGYWSKTNFDWSKSSKCLLQPCRYTVPT